MTAEQQVWGAEYGHIYDADAGGWGVGPLWEARRVLVCNRCGARIPPGGRCVRRGRAGGYVCGTCVPAHPVPNPPLNYGGGWHPEWLIPGCSLCDYARRCHAREQQARQPCPTCQGRGYVGHADGG